MDPETNWIPVMIKNAYIPRNGSAYLALAGSAYLGICTPNQLCLHRYAEPAIAEMAFKRASHRSRINLDPS